MKPNFRFSLALSVFGILVLLSSPAGLWGSDIPLKCDADQDGYFKDVKKCWIYNDDYDVDCNDNNFDTTNNCIDPGEDVFHTYRAFLTTLDEENNEYAVQNDDFEVEVDIFSDHIEYVDGFDEVYIGSTTASTGTGLFRFDTYTGRLSHPKKEIIPPRNVWMDLSNFMVFDPYYGNNYFDGLEPNWIYPDQGGSSGEIPMDMRMGGLDLDLLCVAGEHPCPESPSCYMGLLGDPDCSNSPAGKVILGITFPMDGAPNDIKRILYNCWDEFYDPETQCLVEDVNDKSTWPSVVVTRISTDTWIFEGSEAYTQIEGGLSPLIHVPFKLTIIRID